MKATQVVITRQCWGFSGDYMITFCCTGFPTLLKPTVQFECLYLNLGKLSEINMQQAHFVKKTSPHSSPQPVIRRDWCFP